MSKHNQQEQLMSGLDALRTNMSHPIGLRAGLNLWKPLMVVKWYWLYGKFSSWGWVEVLFISRGRVVTGASCDLQTRHGPNHQQESEEGLRVSSSRI